MPVFNHSSGAIPFGPGNFYGVGAGKYGAPTTIVPPRPPPVTAEDFLARLLLSCEQWLALPAADKNYAAYLLCVEYRNRDDASGCPEEIVALITNHCRRLRSDTLATTIDKSIFKASGNLDVSSIAKPAIAGLVGLITGGAIAYWASKRR